MMIWRLRREIKVEEQIWHLLAYGWNLKLWEWEEKSTLNGIPENTNIEENNNIKSHNEVPLQKWLKWKNTDGTENADNSTVVKDADQLGLSCITGSVQNATAILEKS